MRTTVNIDDDLLLMVRERAQKEGIPLRQALNQALRTGLEQVVQQKKGKPYRCPTFSMGDPSPYNLHKALLVADALEDAETERKLTLRK